MTYIAYTAGAIFILLGLAILFTDIFPAQIPSQLKLMMGIVFTLYGVFRIVATTFNKKRRQSNEESD
jgi:hypothetical protein